MTPEERKAFLDRPDIRAAIKANVDAAPPLSDQTKARLRALFATVRRPVAQDARAS